MIPVANIPVLVLFCRRPALGTGKQRIAAELGPEKALQISQLLLAAAVEDMTAWSGQVVVAPALADDAAWARQQLPDTLVVPQCSGNLGERIQFVDTELRSKGYQRIIFIGSDAPDLTPEALDKAAVLLERETAVVIPAHDGGVTLLGTSTPWPELGDLPWETSELCSALVQRCRASNLNCAQLSVSYDVDTWADLDEAQSRLVNDPRSSRHQICDWVNQQRTVSIVIPVYRDLQALAKLLARLEKMRDEQTEIMVVDGDNSADCAQLCAHHDAAYSASPPCRGGQLAAGARNTQSDILWFLHADSAPPADAVSLLRQHIGAGHCGGYFRFRFSGAKRWHKSLLQSAINWRARKGIPYGDQGLFVRRKAYEASAGHADIPLFEEVRLVKALRRIGHFMPIKAEIGVSPRRWERDGWLYSSLRNRVLAIAFMLGADPATLAHYYRSRRTLGTLASTHTGKLHG